MNRHTLLSLLALISILGSTAQAMPPLSRQSTGTVARVESDSPRFLWRSSESDRELLLTWNRRTTFYLHGEKASGQSLRTGQPVRVSYRTPFIGPAYASRVVILAPQSTGTGK